MVNGEKSKLKLMIVMAITFVQHIRIHVAFKNIQSKQVEQKNN
jgi:hypothetical protein